MKRAKCLTLEVNVMAKMWKILGLIGMLVSAASLSACSIDVERNDDGSLTATSTMSEASLSEEMAIALDQLENVSVDLHGGAMTITGDRPRPDGSQTDHVSLRVDLGNDGGQLTATISELTVNGQPAPDDRLAQMNDRIAERLERRAANHPNRTLESVTVADSDLTLVWRVETPQSKQD